MPCCGGCTCSGYRPCSVGGAAPDRPRQNTWETDFRPEPASIRPVCRGRYHQSDQHYHTVNGRDHEDGYGKCWDAWDATDATSQQEAEDSRPCQCKVCEEVGDVSSPVKRAVYYSPRSTFLRSLRQSSRSRGRSNGGDKGECTEGRKNGRSSSGESDVRCPCQAPCCQCVERGRTRKTAPRASRRDHVARRSRVKHKEELDAAWHEEEVETTYCKRCWRYASVRRSPVNKPEQRYDPNYRRGLSGTARDNETEVRSVRYNPNIRRGLSVTARDTETKLKELMSPPLPAKVSAATAVSKVRKDSRSQSQVIAELASRAGNKSKSFEKGAMGKSNVETKSVACQCELLTTTRQVRGRSSMRKEDSVGKSTKRKEDFVGRSRLSWEENACPCCRRTTEASTGQRRFLVNDRLFAAPVDETIYKEPPSYTTHKEPFFYQRQQFPPAQGDTDRTDIEHRTHRTDRDQSSVCDSRWLYQHNLSADPSPTLCCCDSIRDLYKHRIDRAELALGTDDPRKKYGGQFTAKEKANREKQNFAIGNRRPVLTAFRSDSMALGCQKGVAERMRQA